MSRQTVQVPSPTTATTQYWNEWAQLSPYSPYNLRHLRQPTPSDLPADAAADASLFGFEDAFEDLLAATSLQPQPLADLRQQAAYKRQARAIFHGGEPPILWVDRLRNRGLLRVPLLTPGQHPLQGLWTDIGAHENSAVLQGIREWRRQQDDMTDPEELQRRRAEVREGLKQIMSDLSSRIDWDSVFDPTELIRRVEMKVKDFEKALDDEFTREKPEQCGPNDRLRDTWRSASGMEQSQKQITPDGEDSWLENFLSHVDGSSAQASAKGAIESSRKDRQQEGQQPDTEEDLFSLIESAFSQADSSIKSFFNAFTDDVRVEPARTDKPQPQPVEAAERNEFGGKTIRSTTEHVDMFGLVHQKIEVKKMDARGNTVSSESKYSVRTRSPQEKVAARRTNVDANDPVPAMQGEGDREKASAAATNDGKTSGWFWR